jgi:predicted O-linked N-acetylglucosamine transferase (SPINDLY family)
VHAARVGASLLARVGHPEWTATDPDAYIRTAVALSRDPEQLAALRGTLRSDMTAGGLTDESAFVRALESAFAAMVAQGPRV